MNTELSQMMQKAIGQMRKHNNKLVRLPGGWWLGEGVSRFQGPMFGTSTVEALVKRGLAEYTTWKDGRNGAFPIECMLKAQQ